MSKPSQLITQDWAGTGVKKEVKSKIKLFFNEYDAQKEQVVFSHITSNGGIPSQIRGFLKSPTVSATDKQKLIDLLHNNMIICQVVDESMVKGKLKINDLMLLKYDKSGMDAKSDLSYKTTIDKIIKGDLNGTFTDKEGEGEGESVAGSINTVKHKLNPNEETGDLPQPAGTTLSKKAFPSATHIDPATLDEFHGDLIEKNALKEKEIESLKKQLEESQKHAEKLRSDYYEEMTNHQTTVTNTQILEHELEDAKQKLSDAEIKIKQHSETLKGVTARYLDKEAELQETRMKHNEAQEADKKAQTHDPDAENTDVDSDIFHDANGTDTEEPEETKPGLLGRLKQVGQKVLGQVARRKDEKAEAEAKAKEAEAEAKAKEAEAIKEPPQPAIEIPATIGEQIQQQIIPIVKSLQDQQEQLKQETVRSKLHQRTGFNHHVPVRAPPIQAHKILNSLHLTNKRNQVDPRQQRINIKMFYALDMFHE